jgi:hypothetical protein
VGADFHPFASGSVVTAPDMPDMMRQLLTQAGAIGGLLLLAILGTFVFQRFRRRKSEAQFDTPMFALLTGLALFAPIMLMELSFDRYLIPILPCLLLAAAVPAAGWKPSRAALAAGWAALALIACYSVVATHDFMELKRVQSRAYGDITGHVRPEFVDGGWVLNGPVSFGRHGGGRRGEPTKMLGWYERADYIVGTRRAPGYRPVAAYPVKLWLTWGGPVRPILVQQRAPLQ